MRTRWRERACLAALAVGLASITWAQPAATPREAVVLPGVENMYSGPDAGRDVVSQALIGQVVGVIAVEDGFVRIETPDGYRGWIPQGSLFLYRTSARRATRRAARWRR